MPAKLRRNSCPPRTAARVIKLLRAYNGTLAGVARNTGLSYSLIEKLSSGEKTSISPETAARLLGWLEVQ